MITTSPPKPWRVNRREYDRLGELGFFQGKRVELLNGQVIETNAMESPHAISVSLCDDIVRTIFGSGYHTRCQLPLALNE